MFRLDACHAKGSGAEASFIAKALDVAGTYAGPLRRIADIVGLLDVLAAMASTLSLIPSGSDWISAETCDDCPCLEVEAGRHPLLELYRGLRAKFDPVIPNDVKMGHEHTRVYVVTGPNMGGKSTYARQQALIAYMSQLGLPISAQRAKLQPFSLFWTRIGAQDNPSSGASTFMTEAVETAVMLQTMEHCQARPCLLIVDELGRGTGARDGMAFARAVLAKLMRTPRVFAIFATHFHELGRDAHGITPVCFDKSFSYTLKPGIEHDSDGINLAHSFGFPEKIIRTALASCGST